MQTPLTPLPAPFESAHILYACACELLDAHARGWCNDSPPIRPPTIPVNILMNQYLRAFGEYS